MTAPAPNPYVGLRPFETADAGLFFGRRQQTRELLDRLSGGRFVAVVGGSGCGKSSLVRAGLIPRLKAGFLVKDRDEWRVVVMKPGASPLPRLAASLVAGGNGEVDAFAASLADEGVDALIRQVKQGLGERRSLLLVVDQFEELFGTPRTADPSDVFEQVALFISLLLDLARAPELPAFVAITMRSDFIGDCGRFAALADALNRGLYVVPGLTREQRRESILGPARWAGGSLNSALVDRLLNQCDRDGDQLPVLQHALMRTWQRWQESGKESADLGNFEAAGGFERAIHNHAEKTLRAAVSAGNGDGEARRALIARLFQALTEIDLANRAIRRRTSLSTLTEVTGASWEDVRRALEPFREQSFLVLSEEEDPVVDLSHESLIGRWKTLASWVEDEARSAAEYRRLVEAAVLYRRGADGQRRGGLLEDPALSAALRWRDQCRPNAAWARRVRPPEILQAQPGANGREGRVEAVRRKAFPLAMAFLDRSRRERDAAAKSEALKAAKAWRQRQLRVRWSWAVGLAIPVLGFLALHQHIDNRREDARTKAVTEAFEALGLAMESGVRQRTSPWASLFLATAALRSTRELQQQGAIVGETDLSKVQSHAETAMRRALAGVDGGTIVAVQGKALVALAPDVAGRFFYSAEDDGAIREGLVRPARPQLAEELTLRLKPSSPRGGRTHLGTGAGWVASGRGQTVALLGLEAPSNAVIVRTESSVSALSVGRNGKWLAIATENGQVQLFDLEQARRDDAMSVRVGRAAVAHVRLSSDGRWLAAADTEGAWGLWALSPEGPRAMERHASAEPRARVSALDFDLPRRRLLIATSQGLSAVELGLGRSSRPSPLSQGTTSGITADRAPKIDDLQVSPDGRWLALRTQEGRLSLVALGALQGPLSPGTSLGPRDPGQSFAFTSDSRLLLLGGRDGIVSRWELPHDASSPGARAEDIGGQVQAVALSPDLTWQAIGTLEGQVKIRDIDGPGRTMESVHAPHALPPLPTLALGDAIAAVKVSPDGRWLASLTRANALSLWETGPDGLQRRTTLEGVSQIEIGGTGGRLVLGTTSPAGGPGGGPAAASIRELTAAGLGPAFSLGAAERLVLSPSGRFLSYLTRLPGGGVALWAANNLPSPAKPVLLVENGAPITALAIGHGDEWLVAGNVAGEIRLWNLAARRTDRDQPAMPSLGSEIVLSGGKAPITIIAVGGNEERLVTGDAEGIVRVYALRPRVDREPATLAAHEGPVRAATLSPTGRHLLTRGEDGATLLWQLDHADPVPQIVADPSGPIVESAFTDDGSHLLTVTVAGSPRWWSLDPDQLLRDARVAAGRDLCQSEWTRLIPGLPFRQVIGELP